MHEALARHYEGVERWCQDAHARGWLDDTGLHRLADLERGSPGDLFESDVARPLVVALFGGTGVGKSSLLNRLAHEPIARTGIERPTSLEVTAYLHETVALGQLPADLPLERLRIARHRDEQRRDLMWIDMPDIDSTEAANRALAMAWLPHIDLLVYVVSPERYRDDAGWRVLLQRSRRHGWLFIMNHWDQGGEDQLQDLAGILQEAGFAEPVIITTCCSPPACAERDGFPRLVETIDALRAAHGQRELERLGYAARLGDLELALQEVSVGLGSSEQWRGLHGQFFDALDATRAEILEGMQWSIRDLAAGLRPAGRSLVGHLLGSELAGGVPASASAEGMSDARPGSELRDRLSRSVWDAWASRKLEETVDELELAMRRELVTAGPLIEAMRAVAAGAGDAVVERSATRLRQALARPGGRMRRLLRAVTGHAMALLPAAALAWVALYVVQAFYRGVSEQGAFLGVDFAINALLLVLVAWLLPFLAHRLLRPSPEKAAERALQLGIEEGLGRITGAMVGEFDRLGAEREALLLEAERLRSALVSARGEGGSAHPAVVRLLSDSNR